MKQDIDPTLILLSEKNISPQKYEFTLQIRITGFLGFLCRQHSLLPISFFVLIITCLSSMFVAFLLLMGDEFNYSFWLSLIYFVLSIALMRASVRSMRNIEKIAIPLAKTWILSHLRENGIYFSDGDYTNKDSKSMFASGDISEFLQVNETNYLYQMTDGDIVLIKIDPSLDITIQISLLTKEETVTYLRADKALLLKAYPCDEKILAAAK